MVEEEGLEPSGSRRLFMYHTKEESNLNPIPISSVFYGGGAGNRTLVLTRFRHAVLASRTTISPP